MIFIKRIQKFTSEPSFTILRYTYLSNMRPLSQTMLWKIGGEDDWKIFLHRSWNTENVDQFMNKLYDGTIIN